jgi:hypothetical protein
VRPFVDLVEDRRLVLLLEPSRLQFDLQMNGNLAFGISRTDSLLVADVCPQCNFTEILFGGGQEKPKVTISSALLSIEAIS